jgi:hypothetical protein
VFKIADNQERRIFQIFPVLLKLPVSLIEVFLFAFVFPAEVFLFPNVGKPALGWRAVGRVEIQKLRVFGNELLKTEKILAARIGFVWRRLAEQPAQINEVFNVGLRFLAPVAPPLRFEFSGRHWQRLFLFHANGIADINGFCQPTESTNHFSPR